MNWSGVSVIAGDPAGAGSDRFRAVAAASGETIEPDFVVATTEEIDRAVEAAEGARNEFAGMAPTLRAKFLESIATRLEAKVDLFVDRTTVETGLPEPRIRLETGRTANQLKMFAEILREGSWVDARIDRGDPARQPPKPDVRSLRRPLGPVAVFCASNFPLAFSVAGGDTASALAAGNPVVAVAHPAHPGTAELVATAIADAADECDVPPGVFSLLQGPGEKIAPHLLHHPSLRAVGFTGSRKGGLALRDLAARRPDPIPVFAEMSSVNPVILFPKRLANSGAEIAKALAQSITLGVGQFCTNPGLVFVPKGDDARSFVEELGSALSEFPGGTMLTESIRQSYEEGAKRRSKLATRVTTGSGQSLLFTTDLKTFRDHPELSEELFGPSSLVIEWDDFGELLAALSSLEGQLTATVHAEATESGDLDQLVSVLEQKAGRLLWGGFPTGVEVCSAMVHGGPFPATTDAGSTSVGGRAIDRFTRLVCYQDFPLDRLPEELRDENPRKIARRINGRFEVDGRLEGA